MFDNAHIRLSLTRGKKVLFSQTSCLNYVNSMIVNNCKILLGPSFDVEMGNII
jgi:hypothetical protein